MDKCVRCNRNLAVKGFLCDECTTAQNELTIKIQQQIADKLKKAKEKLKEIVPLAWSKDHTP